MITPIDTFISEVPWAKSRSVLVHRRTWGCREYVRLRTWNRHREKHVWYPSTRSFIIPIGRAEDLAAAIHSAAQGEASDKPDWLLAWEREEAERAAVKHEAVLCGEGEAEVTSPSA